MSNKSGEYEKMLEEHVNKLTSFGRLYLMELGGCVDLLRRYYSGELEQVKTEEQKIFDTLIKRQKEFVELIEWSIKERQAYVDANQSDFKKE